jgi:predicted nucleotidyltransferase
MFLDNYIQDITKLCREGGVTRLYAFGSVLTDRFTDKSDIDLLVEIEANGPSEYTEKYFNLIYSLQDLLDRHVDLLEERAIRNKYLKAEIEKTRQLIYG